MSYITLESLIQEHKERIDLLKYQPDPPGCWGFSYYYYEDSEAYQKWLAKTKRFIAINYPSDKYVNEFEVVSNGNKSPEQQKKLLAILEAFAVLPTVIPDNRITQVAEKKGDGKDSINVVTTINNSNSQSQDQGQSLAVELFIEAIKDDLTGRQIKELKAVVADVNNDLQKARPGIITKLKEFGSDVVSNIVANILTNPAIWSGL
mgnify:FL=1